MRNCCPSTSDGVSCLMALGLPLCVDVTSPDNFASAAPSRCLGVGGVTIAAAGFLLLVGKLRAAFGLILAVAGGAVLSMALKAGLDRHRPDVVPHFVQVGSGSFPSGHAMLATITYLTLGAMLARVQPKFRVRVYLLSWAVLLSLLVGASRVYLGVHWPTDVLAGWSLGAAWALLCALVGIWLERRAIIQGEVPLGDRAERWIQSGCRDGGR